MTVAPQSGQFLREIFAFDELHRQEAQPGFFAILIECDDVLVFQPRDRTRLALEALAEGAVGVGAVHKQHFHRRRALQLDIDGLVDARHAARRPQPPQLVIAEPVADQSVFDLVVRLSRHDDAPRLLR